MREFYCEKVDDGIANFPRNSHDGFGNGLHLSVYIYFLAPSCIARYSTYSITVPLVLAREEFFPRTSNSASLISRVVNIRKKFSD